MAERVRLPRLRSGGGWRLGDGRFQCIGCSSRTSVTAGTIFDRTRTRLTVWFTACWLFATAKEGVSAMNLERVLEIGSYQTARAMLHRLRSVLVRPGRDRLAGRVEVDETFIGGPEPGLSGVRSKGKKVLTGGGRGSAAEGHRRNALLPAVHRVASLTKRWLLGTHQGAVEEDYLPSYMNEFVFRFNRRTSRRRGMVFYRVLELAVDHAPVRYGNLLVSRRPPENTASPSTQPRQAAEPSALPCEPPMAFQRGSVRLDGYPQVRLPRSVGGLASMIPQAKRPSPR